MVKRKVVVALLAQALLYTALIALAFHNQVLFGLIVILWCVYKVAIALFVLCTLPFCSVIKQEQPPS